MSEQIYALTCNGLPFYVGHTTQQLTSRLSQHISESKDGTSAKCCFIRERQAENHEIGIILLETIESYLNEEQIWVEEMEARGIKLTNSKQGDDHTTPAEQRKLRDDIQEAKKRNWKPKPKPAEYDPIIGRAKQDEVQRLVQLYETDRAQFDIEYAEFKRKENERRETEEAKKD